MRSSLSFIVYLLAVMCVFYKRFTGNSTTIDGFHDFIACVSIWGPELLGEFAPSLAKISATPMTLTLRKWLKGEFRGLVFLLILDTLPCFVCESSSHDTVGRVGVLQAYVMLLSEAMPILWLLAVLNFELVQGAALPARLSHAHSVLRQEVQNMFQ